MEYLILIGMLILNFAAAWWDAYQGGKFWTEVKVVGGWARVIVWAAVVMSAVGFTWVYLTILSIVGVLTGFLTIQQFDIAIKLGYLIVVPFLITSGIVINVQSIVRAYRTRRFGDAAVAVYNTLANTHNIWQAASVAPDFLGDVIGFFSSDSSSDSDSDGDKAKGMLLLGVVLVVILAIAGGVITTVLIVRKADKEFAMDVTEGFDL